LTARKRGALAFSKEEKTFLFKLKKSIKECTMLINPDRKNPFCLEVVALNGALGGILRQVRGTKEGLRPVAFALSKLSKAE
jgi:RNase H-like domain found in reverse transcriptase